MDVIVHNILVIACMPPKTAIFPDASLTMTGM